MRLAVGTSDSDTIGLHKGNKPFHAVPLLSFAAGGMPSKRTANRSEACRDARGQHWMWVARVLMRPDGYHDKAPAFA